MFHREGSRRERAMETTKVMRPRGQGRILQHREAGTWFIAFYWKGREVRESVARLRRAFLQGKVQAANGRLRPRAHRPSDDVADRAMDRGGAGDSDGAGHGEPEPRDLQGGAQLRSEMRTSRRAAVYPAAPGPERPAGLLRARPDRGVDRGAAGSARRRRPLRVPDGLAPAGDSRPTMVEHRLGGPGDHAA